MKNFILFWILLPLYLYPERMLALDVAYATNGVIVAVPVSMPVVGVRLDTDQSVLNLYSADTATLNACGYYPIVRFDRSTIATNDVVASRSWKIEEGKAVEVVTTKPKPVRVTLSRVKLSRLVKASGWSSQFLAFVNSDPEISVRWFSAEKLVAGSDDMKPFIDGFAALVGIDYASALKLLEYCRED